MNDFRDLANLYDTDILPNTKVEEEKVIIEQKEHDDQIQIVELEQYFNIPEGKKVERIDEGILDRLKARAGGVGGAIKDTASNIKGAVTDANITGDPSKKATDRKNVKYNYEQKKAQSIYNAHINKIYSALSNFATDLVKLGMMEEQDAEALASQALTTVKDSRRLKNVANLHNVKR